MIIIWYFNSDWSAILKKNIFSIYSFSLRRVTNLPPEATINPFKTINITYAHYYSTESPLFKSKSLPHHFQKRAKHSENGFHYSHQDLISESSSSSRLQDFLLFFLLKSNSQYFVSLFAPDSEGRRCLRAGQQQQRLPVTVTNALGGRIFFILQQQQQQSLRRAS